MPNRLAHETSPYLLQHADNPVDWFPWSDEAFERARSDDKPVLLSVGYAACHWCHVMEHESFEDPETARLMNELFVNVKVDREERPDVDAIYMEAVQSMTGHGGWPMTVFLTPDGKPFYGGTYFPNEDRHGMPSFQKVLRAVHEAWRERRDEVERQGDHLVEHIGVADRLSPSSEPPARALVETAADTIGRSYDEQYGGFGSAPKFPQPMTIDFLLRRAAAGDERAGDMARHTLNAMAAGGMFDQIGGGFARYSVDRYWLIPHFEKMLYDNAQLLRTYARAYRLFGSERHRYVAEATARWMMREMRDPAGGFASSLDADTEGEEGLFYVFTLDEVREATGDDFDEAVRLFGFNEEGNFEGRSVPIYARRPEDERRAESIRRALYDYRERRVRPGKDDKVLAGWNGLAVAGLAEAGTLLGRRDWVEAAAEAMRFVLSTLRVDGRLMRSYRDGKVGHLGYAEDYAFILEGLLALYEAEFDARWIEEAVWAADEAVRLFHDPDGGGFFTTGEDAERLVARPKDMIDNALPAANSALALGLARLSRITGETKYEDPVDEILSLLAEPASRSPLGFGHLLGALDFMTGDAREVVVVGDPTGDAGPLLEVARAPFPHDRVVLCSADPESAAARLHLFEGRSRVDGKATAYVCRRGTCNLPVTSPEALGEQLAS
ncbi:MAG TPA: thioredoxin domain-containing protein [Actinomycetota bacterium]|nr:thioredoxin domain-containing protein [Actinomycetota bacterium]